MKNGAKSSSHIQHAQIRTKIHDIISRRLNKFYLFLNASMEIYYRNCRCVLSVSFRDNNVCSAV